ncbi:MAG: T9SS type A sorting domain-containing protein, partial [Bacteroidia bacterium]|nr:T9SS type A sorting domain-containing protein [Bacteroidia bacterium]
PEINQTLSISFSCSEPAAFSTTQLMNTPTYQSFNCKFVAKDLPTGLYYVTVIATDNGTPAEQTIETIVIRSSYDPGVVTGMSQVKKENTVILFPNPNEGLFTIQHDIEQTELPVLTVMNILGQKQMEISLQKQTQVIEIQNLKSGIYITNIITKNGLVKSLKMIVK